MILMSYINKMFRIYFTALIAKVASQYNEYNVSKVVLNLLSLMLLIKQQIIEPTTFTWLG